MLKVQLIRHGQTEGNKLGRYIGTTDEPLSPEGKDFLRGLFYEEPQAVYVSPLTRCIETAQLLFPGKELQVIEELSECDFGDFENKNYKELSGNPDYQAWIDSNGTLPFPKGESREEFQKRSLKGLEKVMEDCGEKDVAMAALVIHGGTIMNIMEAYAGEKRPFYEWHVKNGGGYTVEAVPEGWRMGKKELRLLEAFPEGKKTDKQ